MQVGSNQVGESCYWAGLALQLSSVLYTLVWVCIQHVARKRKELKKDRIIKHKKISVV